jgi:hypothetical protein
MPGLGDQLVIVRPIRVSGCFRQASRSGSTRHTAGSSIQKSPYPLVICWSASTCAANWSRRIIPDSSSSPPKKQELSPSRVPKVSTSSRFEETNTLFDMLKQRYAMFYSGLVIGLIELKELKTLQRAPRRRRNKTMQVVLRTFVWMIGTYFRRGIALTKMIQKNLPNQKSLRSLKSSFAWILTKRTLRQQ